MSLYLILKYIHVLLAIIAVGTNATYAVWLTRSAREPQHLGYVLKGVRFLDNRIANPAYGLLLVTGMAMVVVGQIPWTTSWIRAAIGLFIVVLALAIWGYSPALRQQIAVAESAGAQSERYKRAAARGQTFGLVLTVVVLVIVFLMVTKPTLW